MSCVRQYILEFYRICYYETMRTIEPLNSPDNILIEARAVDPPVEPITNTSTIDPGSITLFQNQEAPTVGSYNHLPMPIEQTSYPRKGRTLRLLAGMTAIFNVFLIFYLCSHASDVSMILDGSPLFLQPTIDSPRPFSGVFDLISLILAIVQIVLGVMIAAFNNRIAKISMVYVLALVLTFSLYVLIATLALPEGYIALMVFHPVMFLLGLLWGYWILIPTMMAMYILPLLFLPILIISLLNEWRRMRIGRQRVVLVSQ